MRRIISILIVVATLLTTILGLGGCSSKAEPYITVGQWLQMIDESFGMTDYTTDTPFFENVQSTNQYFDAVQIAAEWEVIDVSEPLDINAKLTWKQALLTLINVGNFMDTEASEESKIEFAINSFDSSIRKYWLNRIIAPEKALILLGTAQNQWANKAFDNVIEDVKYKDGVLDLSTSLTENEVYTDNDGTTIIPKDKAQNLKQGDIYVLPPANGSVAVEVYRVESVQTEGDYTYITNASEDIELEDIAEEIFVEETFVPSAEKAVIYDGNGQIISIGSEVTQLSFNNGQNGQNLYTFLPSTNRTPNVVTLYDAQAPKQKHTFTLGDWKIKMEYKINGALDFKFEVETPNMLSATYQNEHPSQELTAAFAAELSNFTVTNEVDYKWFKLRSASLRVDYEQKYSGTLKFSGKPVDKLYAPEYRNTGGFLTNWGHSVWKDADGANAKGAKTIKIGSVDLYTVGVARVCLDINFTISAEGSISVSLTQRGAKGIEYKDGKMRLINTCNKDVDVDVKGKVEATVGVGPALYVVGLKKPIIGLEVKAGMGIALNVKFNLADSDGHLLEEAKNSEFSLEFADLMKNSEIYSDAEQIKEIAEAQGCTYDILTSEKIKLHCDVCVDGCVYFILKVQLTDTSYIAGLLGNKITTSWEAFGEKNGKLFNVHVDNGQFQIGYPGKKVECTLKYVPFDNADMEADDNQDDVQDNESIINGDAIIINELFTSLNVGKNYYIQLKEIPSGYKASELICSSSDESIASVNNDGVVTAKKAGSVVITISTKDKKYSAYLAVTVVDEAQSEFVSMNSSTLVGSLFFV